MIQSRDISVNATLCQYVRSYHRLGLKVGAQRDKAAEAGFLFSPFSGLVSTQPGLLAPGGDGGSVFDGPCDEKDGPEQSLGAVLVFLRWVIG